MNGVKKRELLVQITGFKKPGVLSASPVVEIQRDRVLVLTSKEYISKFIQNREQLRPSKILVIHNLLQMMTASKVARQPANTEPWLTILSQGLSSSRPPPPPTWSE